MARKSNGSKQAGDRRSKGWLAWVLGSADSYEGYFAQSRSLALSFVLIAPLLILYEAALLCYPKFEVRGAGGWVRGVLSRAFGTRAGVAVNTAVVVVLLLAVVVLARRKRLRLYLIIPMVLESAVWTAAHVGLAVFLMQTALRMRIPRAPLISFDFRNVVSAVGAGVYEEILFRLMLTSVLFLFGLKLFPGKNWYAMVFAVTISSLVFALCHIFDPATRADWILLLYYFYCGLFWSVVYALRGLGVAVYAHVLFDIVAYLGQG